LLVFLLVVVTYINLPAVAENGHELAFYRTNHEQSTMCAGSCGELEASTVPCPWPVDFLSPTAIPSTGSSLPSLRSNRSRS
jgi:hypothetical protein